MPEQVGGPGQTPEFQQIGETPEVEEKGKIGGKEVKKGEKKLDISPKEAEEPADTGTASLEGRDITPKKAEGSDPIAQVKSIGANWEKRAESISERVESSKIDDDDKDKYSANIMDLKNEIKEKEEEIENETDIDTKEELRSEYNDIIKEFEEAINNIEEDLNKKETRAELLELLQSDELSNELKSLQDRVENSTLPEERKLNLKEELSELLENLSDLNEIDEDELPEAAETIDTFLDEVKSEMDESDKFNERLGTLRDKIFENPKKFDLETRNKIDRDVSVIKSKLENKEYQIGKEMLSVLEGNVDNVLSKLTYSELRQKKAEIQSNVTKLKEELDVHTKNYESAPKAKIFSLLAKKQNANEKYLNAKHELQEINKKISEKIKEGSEEIKERHTELLDERDRLENEIDKAYTRIDERKEIIKGKISDDKPFRLLQQRLMTLERKIKKVNDELREIET